MRARRGWTRHALLLIGWLARPFVFAFRPGYRAGRAGMQALSRIPADTVQKTLALPDQDAIRSEDVATLRALEQTRARSRTLGRLFGVLMIVDLIFWSRTVFVSGADIFSPPSIIKLAMAVVLGSQFLILALTNWQARTGQAGGLLAFLSDGRNLWPR